MSRVRKDTPIWDKALPLMAAAAAPNLTAVLLVEVARDSQSAALAFIARLPHLTDLALDFASLLHAPSGHTFSLASLRTLYTPPSVADHLLSRAESFRALQSLALVWKSTLDAPLLALIAPMPSIVTTLRARGLAPHVALAGGPLRCVNSLARDQCTTIFNDVTAGPQNVRESVDKLSGVAVRSGEQRNRSCGVNINGGVGEVGGGALDRMCGDVLE
jgi:hypothetical protein